MSLEAIPRVNSQLELTKLSKPKPPILAPSIEPKNASPTSISKIANKKNYVTVKRFNSSIATVGSNQIGQKLQPKLSFIQQAALSNLPEKSIPLSPKTKHKRTSSQTKCMESKQIRSTKSNDSENSISKLVVGDTDYSSENYSQVVEDCSCNCNSDDNFDNNINNNPIKNPIVSRKRKMINCSNSFCLPQQNGPRRINSSFSYLEYKKKSANEAPIPLSQSHRQIKSVSSKLSLAENSSNDQIITIQLTSNWGNSKSLLLSTVSVLDENRKSIPINTISSVPDLSKINLLEKFTDHKLVKNENDVFKIEYDLSIKEKFSLILTIDESTNPRYVRIWNPNLKDEELLSASVKNVTIYLGNKKVAEGEVPKNFGVDIEFQNENDDFNQYNSSLLIDELFPSFKIEEKIKDSFGVYPLGKTKTITFEVLSTYKNSDKFESIGLNGVDFYNDKGVKINNNDLDFITVRNIFTSSYANPKNIVKDSMDTCVKYHQFLGNYQQDCSDRNDIHNAISITNPLFIFTFNQPTSISMIRIWNYNSAEGGLEYGIKKMIIRNNDRIVWCGKIKKGLGFTKGLERSATNIWLTDSVLIKDQVLKNMINY